MKEEQVHSFHFTFTWGDSLSRIADGIILAIQMIFLLCPYFSNKCIMLHSCPLSMYEILPSYDTLFVMMRLREVKELAQIHKAL